MAPARFSFAGGYRAPRVILELVARRRNRVGRGDHARRDGAVGLGIDQNECARGTILAIEVERNRMQQIDVYDADVIHLQRLGGLMRQRADVGAMLQR